MQNYLFKNISVVNEGKIIETDVFVKKGIIQIIGQSISPKEACIEINGEGKHLLPGVIDDQVHFREPGLTHKGNLYTESRAAVAGGTTSFMEMPNTIPNALNLQLLEDKYNTAAQHSLANFSFYMGVSNDNAEDALQANAHKKDICGLKIFMGSSTGNMLVNNHATLNRIFSESELLIATHCEDEQIIKKNYAAIKSSKQNLTPADHPFVRNDEACYESSLVAIQFAKKYNSRLHIFHISTQKELALFGNMLPLHQKRITAEVCVHHLHFTAGDYNELGYLIKCNPAIKNAENKDALWEALLNDKLDVIATDHAPHLLSEKQPPYEDAHSGLPLVQHSLLLMLYYEANNRISLQKIVEKMSHAPAVCFGVEKRGFIKEGYYADLVMIDKQQPYKAIHGSLLYKCGWSPLENFTFPASVEMTMVNGNIVYQNNRIIEGTAGMRLQFSR